LNDTLNYIIGGFYLNQKPNGPQRLLVQTFAVPGTPFTNPPPASGALSALAVGGGSGNGDYFHDTSKAAFGQVSYKLSGLSAALWPFSVDLGLRHTKDEESVCTAPFQMASLAPTPEGACPSAPFSSSSSTQFSKTTYTFGVNYKPTDKILVYVVTRSGYRAGGLNVPHFGGTLLPFQSYTPETVKDVELGFKSDWKFNDVAGRFNIALYHSKYDNLQAGLPTGNAADPDGDGNPTNNPSNNTFYANVGTATVQGIESELTVLPIESLELSLGGAYIDKKIDELTVQLPNTLTSVATTKQSVGALAFLGSPDYSYTASLRYTLPLAPQLGSVSFATRYFRISKVDYGSVHAPEGEKLDLRLDWVGVLQSQLDVSLFVTNLTNDRYPVGPGNSNLGLSINSGTFNEPRIAGAQLRYTFGAH
jgi:iron complex outermembrane receptor protein